jgi:hypothetical protein
VRENIFAEGCGSDLIRCDRSGLRASHGMLEGAHTERSAAIRKADASCSAIEPGA